MATIEIPLLNSIPIRKFWLSKPIKAFYAPYIQKFEQSDSTSFCIITESVLHAFVYLVDESDNIIKDYTDTYVMNNPQRDVYQYSYKISFNGVSGSYRLKVSIYDLSYYSEYLCIKQYHPYTKLISYKSNENCKNVIFSEDVIFRIRVECDYSYNAYIPKSEDIIYESGYGQNTTLNSATWDNYRINIGGKRGIPDWMHSILNKAFGLSYIDIDGEKITKVESATWESIEEDNYNLRSWTIEITEDKNQNIYSEKLITANGEQEINIEFNENSSYQYISIYSTGNWEVLTPIPNWITIDQYSGKEGSSNIKLTTANNYSEIREFSLQIYLVEFPGVKCTINITQDLNMDSHDWILENGTWNMLGIWYDNGIWLY